MDEIGGGGGPDSGLPGVDGPRPLVGRRTERRLLHHLLDEARAGRPGLVVVSGLPGAGKTALLGWLAATAAPATVLRTSGGAPSLPLAAVLRLVAPLPELAGARDRWLVAEGAGPGPGDAVEDEPPTIDVAAGEVLDALVARARRRPLVVLVDDADDLEPLSARVLEQVVVGLDDAAARHQLQSLVAVASRVSPDPDGFVPRVLRLGSTRALTIGGLDDHDVFEMLAAVGSRPSPTLVHEVLEATGGLPLLVESEVELRTRAPGPSVRVRGIADALRVRLDKVDGATRRLLAVAALLAEPWGVDELAQAAALPVGEVADRIDDALAARLVERDGPARSTSRARPRGDLHFCHPLVRTDLVAALGPVERAALHRAIADRLAAGPASADDDRLLVRAEHLLRAAEQSPPADLADAPEDAQLAATLRRAGQVAMRWGAWHEASRFLSASIRSASEAGSPQERARHHLAAGTAAWFDHDVARCDAELGAALDLAVRAGDGDLRLRVATRLVIARVGARPLRFGQRPDVGELEDALASEGLDPVLVVEGRAVLADAIYASGEAPRAFALVASARRLASGLADIGAEGGGPGERAIAGPLGRLEMAEGLHRMAGLELDAAAACFGAGVEHARTAGDPLATLTLRARRALVALLAGAVDEARAELAAIEPEAMAQRFWGEAGFAAAVLAVAATLAGDAEAPAVAERARRLYRRSGHAYTAAVVAPAVAALAARQHGLAEPLDAPSIGRADAPPTGRGAPGGDEGLRTSSAVGVLCAVEANDATAARARLAAVSWRRGRAGPPTLANLPVLAALVEAGDLVGDRTAVLAARPALVEADRRGVAVVLGWPALVPRLLAVAARQAGDAGEARFQVERALRLTERRHLPAERAKVLVELARLEAEAQAPTQDRARGGPEVAGALLTEAAGIFDAGSLLGWVGRCEAVAHELGVTAAVLPSRVVDDRTILTDDVVGSTAANARLGDVLYLESLRVHDRIVRDRLRELGGDEIKHTGDGVNAIFRHAGDAARCALAIQADLAAWRRAEPDLALEVRCGLARGSLVPADGDYFGLVQSEAARLCALAAAGEVLVSQAVADVLADGRAGAGLTVEPRGRHRLKGLAGDVDVFRVSSDRT